MLVCCRIPKCDIEHDTETGGTSYLTKVGIGVEMFELLKEAKQRLEEVLAWLGIPSKVKGI